MTMKKFVLACSSAAVCAVSLWPAMVAPAFAAVPTPFSEMEAICIATVVLTPDPNSKFRVELNRDTIVTSVGVEYVSNRVTITDIPGGQLISTVGPTFTGNRGRHGGSPNIFGEFKTVSTFTGGTLVQDVTYSQDTTFTYGCRVFKINPQGKESEPDGLQIPGPQHPDPLTITKTEVTRTENINVSNPDVTVENLSDAVICNSPEKNPGKWRQQNGYTGECSTALFISLGTFPIRSNSLPPLESVAGDRSPGMTSSFSNSGPVTLVDDTVEEPSGDAI